MKNILLFITFSLLTIGCGDSGSNTPDAPGIKPEKGETKMILNKTYSVSPGNEVIPKASKTRIKVTHLDSNRGSSVQLIEGSAILKVK